MYYKVQGSRIFDTHTKNSRKDVGGGWETTVKKKWRRKKFNNVTRQKDLFRLMIKNLFFLFI